MWLCVDNGHEIYGFLLGFKLQSAMTIFRCNINLYCLLHRYCSANSLDENLVKGKIVLCYLDLMKTEIGTFSGAIGVVLVGSKAKDVAFLFPACDFHRYEAW